MYARVMADAERAGKRVADGVRFYLQFGSQEVEAYAQQQGYTRAVRAHRRRGHQARLRRVHRLRPRRLRARRSGHRVGDQPQLQGPLRPRPLYLASPLTVAASAVAGEIVEYEDGMFATKK